MPSNRTRALSQISQHAGLKALPEAERVPTDAAMLPFAESNPRHVIPPPVAHPHTPATKPHFSKGVLETSPKSVSRPQGQFRAVLRGYCSFIAHLEVGHRLSTAGVLRARQERGELEEDLVEAAGGLL